MNSLESEGMHPLFGSSIECIPGLDICEPLDVQVESYSENFAPKKYVEVLKAEKHRLINDFQISKRIKRTSPTEMYSAYDTKRNEGVSLVLYDKGSNVADIIKETTLLRRLNSKFILDFYGTVYTETIGKTYLSFEPFECFLSQLLCKEHYELFEKSVVKCVMNQLLNGLKYLHEEKIVHGDVTPKNIVFTESGILKISNFKSARPVGKGKKKSWSLEFCYQPPEVLLDLEENYTASDIWSATCIFAEMLRKQKMFQSLKSDDLLKEIFEILGCPNEKIWPELGESLHRNLIIVNSDHKFNCLDKYFAEEKALMFVKKGFIYNPKHRISADAMLLDPYFVEDPVACSTKNFGMKIHNKKFKEVKYSLPVRG